MRPRFVDCHSHVVPSGDDGAKSHADGIDLCKLAARAGTEILYATPHVWPHLVLTEQRERVIRQAFEELRRDDVTGRVTLSCDILVERESQKGIVIGKGGQMLREIGTRARKELEVLLDAKVYLALRVKVLKDWQRDVGALARLGL